MIAERVADFVRQDLSSARFPGKGVWMSIDHDALVYSTEYGDLRQRQPSAARDLSCLPHSKLPSYSVSPEAVVGRW